MRTVLASAVALVTAAPLLAQAVPGPPPTVGQCDSAATALASGSRDVTDWGILASCGGAGATALASALSDARSETDRDYLEDLYSVARAIRDPALLASAGALTVDRGAGNSGRVTAMLILLSQYDPNLQPSLGTTWADLLTVPLGSSCPIASVDPAFYASRAPLQADSAERVAGALDDVRRDPGEPAVVRDFATCVRQALSAMLPITVDPGSLELSHVCDNRFRVRNLSDEWVDVSFEVVATDDRGDLTIAPGADLVFTTLETGSVRLFYREEPRSSAPPTGVTQPATAYPVAGSRP